MGLTGTIPSQIFQFSQLKRLDLDNNFFTGDIPSQIGMLSQLDYLNLGTGILSGSIPSQIGQLSHLLYLNFGGGNLIGTIPSQIGMLLNLTLLALDNNHLDGTIPSQIGMLSNLYHLTLSNNDLRGEIPTQLENLDDLQQCNVWYGNGNLTCDPSYPIGIRRCMGTNGYSDGSGSEDAPDCPPLPTSSSSTTSSSTSSTSSNTIETSSSLDTSTSSLSMISSKSSTSIVPSSSTSIVTSSSTSIVPSSNIPSSEISLNVKITPGEVYVVDHPLQVDSLTMGLNTSITFIFNPSQSDVITVNGALILGGKLTVNLDSDDSSINDGTIIQLFNLATNSTTSGSFESITVIKSGQCNSYSGTSVSNSSYFGVLLKVSFDGCSEAISLIPTFIIGLIQLTLIYLVAKEIIQLEILNHGLTITL